VPRDLTIQLVPGESRKLDLRLDISQLAENVVVTANAQPLELSQTPASVDVVSREEIDRRQLVSLPDALATMSGAAIARTGREGGLATFSSTGGTLTSPNFWSTARRSTSRAVSSSFQRDAR